LGRAVATAADPSVVAPERIHARRAVRREPAASTAAQVVRVGRSPGAAVSAAPLRTARATAGARAAAPQGPARGSAELRGSWTALAAGHHSARRRDAGPSEAARSETAHGG